MPAVVTVQYSLLLSYKNRVHLVAFAAFDSRPRNQTSKGMVVDGHGSDQTGVLRNNNLSVCRMSEIDEFFFEREEYKFAYN